MKNAETKIREIRLMRDKLVELIDNGCKGANLYDKTKRVNEQVVDYLIENNVVALPFKVKVIRYK